MLRFAQTMLRQAANDVMLSINDVALGANGMFQAQKSLIFKGFSCFRGKKHPPFTIAPFPRPYGLEPAALRKYIEKIVILWYNESERG